MDQERRKIDPVENLQIAGYVAPRLRSQTEGVKKRRIKKIDKEGNVVGETTLEELQKSLCKLQRIEFDVAPGVRPKFIACEACQKAVKVPKTGSIPKRCLEHRDKYFGRCKCGAMLRDRRAVKCRPCTDASKKRMQVFCVECSKQLGKNANAAGAKRCLVCNNKERKRRREETTTKTAARLAREVRERQHKKRSTK